jgi:hypothetical protein
VCVYIYDLLLQRKTSLSTKTRSKVPMVEHFLFFFSHTHTHIHTHTRLGRGNAGGSRCRIAWRGVLWLSAWTIHGATVLVARVHSTLVLLSPPLPPSLPIFLSFPPAPPHLSRSRSLVLALSHTLALALALSLAHSPPPLFPLPPSL